MINFQKNSATLLSIFSIAAISAILFFLSACLATTEREPYPFRERDRRTGELRKIEGLWFLAAAEVTGKLEFYRGGNTWSGRVWFDAYQQWEPLTDIFFDPRTGELQFTRPNYGQRYVGTLTGNQLGGTFAYQGRSLPWEARREAFLNLQRIEGLWFLAAAEVTGKLEFYRDRNTWSGRVWFDAYQQWEPLTDIFFDPRTGELQFTRPNYGQRYTSTLSGNQLVGTFTYEGRSLPWEATRESTRREPGVDLRRIQGLWFLSAANVTGKLEFYWGGNTWSGRVWFDAYQQWEPLTDIFFDPRTGELQFTRPNYGQRYTGTLSGNQLVGTFAYEGKSLPWDARRH